jgi:hypothetical protein
MLRSLIDAVQISRLRLQQLQAAEKRDPFCGRGVA